MSLLRVPLRCLRRREKQHADAETGRVEAEKERVEIEVEREKAELERVVHGDTAPLQ